MHITFFHRTTRSASLTARARHLSDTIRPTISILIPCHNEAPSIRQCIEACFKQSRKPDEIIVIDDASTDQSNTILRSFGNRIRLVTLKKRRGNKSFVQEYGLRYVTSDIFITTDGDSILAPDFVERIERDFRDPSVTAVGGYIRSIKHNWLTALREIDYSLGQNIYKLAQSYINFLFVIPGCAGAFRTEVFKRHIVFDHDTITEDLDFTYKLHAQGCAIMYDRQAIAYTQDPFTIGAYVGQMRRWFGGGWQNLMKHYRMMQSPNMALELSLMYIEGLFFSMLLFILPILNIRFFMYFLIPYGSLIIGCAIFAALKARRRDLLWYAPAYVVLVFLNAWIFVEQFFAEIVFKKKNMHWFQTKRVHL